MKKLIIALVLVLTLGASSAAFAWWDSLTDSSTETNIITIGQGVDLVTASATINPATDGTLVPVSAALAGETGYTTSIEITYDVNLDFAVPTALSFSAVVTDIRLDGVTQADNYVLINVNAPATIDENVVQVTLTVTINDSPADGAAAKAALENAQISFDIDFSAS